MILRTELEHENEHTKLVYIFSEVKVVNCLRYIKIIFKKVTKLKL